MATDARLIRILKTLGLKADHVKTGSITLKPHPDGWLLEWGGVAIVSPELLNEITEVDVAEQRVFREAMAALAGPDEEGSTGD